MEYHHLYIKKKWERNNDAIKDARLMLNRCRRGCGGTKRLNGGNEMNRILLWMLLIFGTANAQSADDSVFGTHWVRFEPLQVGGELQGCSLVYLAVQADRAYLNGDQVAVNGAIGIRTTPNNRLGMSFKVGLKNLSKNTDFERPYFSYLQTTSFSTNKVWQKSQDGEQGYKLFVYNVTEPTTLKMLEEMMSTGKVTIGYNREKDGSDVLVPLDLFVADSEYTADEKVIRKTSPDGLLKFNECFSQVAERLLNKIGEK